MFRRIGSKPAVAILYFDFISRSPHLPLQQLNILLTVAHLYPEAIFAK